MFLCYVYNMKWIKYVITILILILIGINFDKIVDALVDALGSNPPILISDPNEYYRDRDFSYVKLSEDFIPYSKQDLRNIFYTILDKGYETFTFYCPKEYDTCLDDIESISNDPNELTYINSFVSPFNGFANIKIIYSNTGEINAEVNKLYSQKEINSVILKMDEIKKTIYKDDMKVEDKILAVHDYIVEHTKYDSKRKDDKSDYLSNKAYGPLIQGYAVCGGYADAMALFLDDLGVLNYKVTSETHVWNAVYLNNKWLHLDLTWDDPVNMATNKEVLTHKFYLIDTKALEEYEITDHDFDKTVYQELS